jgi:exodeoxyribonuclease V alpha subunit
VAALWAAERVVVEGEAVYLARLHAAEQSVARTLADLLAAPAAELSGWRSAVEAFERRAGYPLSEQQRESVQRVAREKVLVVTGGPGVGKTTVVRAIVSVLDSASLEVCLTAPTGRAAKRLSESTGQAAVTIHRLLEYDPRLRSFRRDRHNPLDANAIVVDEASMVDVQLAASLLGAIPESGRLVLVGDVDQLPSVGPGAVLKDVIESGQVPTVRLDKIFRQNEASSIVHAAHSILGGAEPVSDEAGGERAEFFVIAKSDPAEAALVVRQLVTQRIPQRFGLDAQRDIQVLTPMHRGPVGTLALNASLQEALNPALPDAEPTRLAFREGDKVMQMRNDYDKEVFNGDLGTVLSCSGEGPEVSVGFDGRPVRYVGREADSLSLAYATSIHKSQGSEYPAVVIPLQISHYPMLSRNLIYTGVTRAKRLCVLVADPRALRVALGELRREQRSTGLSQRLTLAIEAAQT